LSEHLNAEDVCYYLFCLACQIWMDESDVVICTYYVAEGGEPLFYSLDFYAVGEGVAEVLEFLVRR
jgi:hypothetical protein